MKITAPLYPTPQLMESSHLTLIEFPSNLGLKEPHSGHEPGVRRLPDFFREHGFHDALKPDGVIRLEPPPYAMKSDRDSGVRNADAIADYAKKQATVLEEVLLEGQFAVVLGGDCSILIGNALALRNMGEFGLFYLDGHTDFMLPEQSKTEGAAGMDLAFITGHGPVKLTDIGGRKPYISEKHVWCVGNRDLEAWYVDAILHSDIHYTDLAALRKEGIAKCVERFLNMVKKEGLAGFWIHFDVDVLDDEMMPAVDSRQPGGLLYSELNHLLGLLLTSPCAVGLDITILDPDLDPEGRYTKELVRNLTSVLAVAPAPENKHDCEQAAEG